MYLPADKLGLHIRGGAILPTQRPDVTTVYRYTHKHTHTNTLTQLPPQLIKDFNLRVQLYYYVQKRTCRSTNNFSKVQKSERSLTVYPVVFDSCAQTNLAVV